MSGYLSDALGYRTRGWCILPMRQKKPACRWKRYQSSRPDNATFCRWFRRSDLDGLGVVLGDVSGGLTCRDFDRMDGYDRWSAEYPALADELPTAATGRGRHVYFRCDERRIVHLGNGELRGGGFNVLPPSIHPNGQCYRWLVPLPNGDVPTIDPHDVGLALVEEKQNETEQTEQTEQLEQLEHSEQFKAICVAIATCAQAIELTLPQATGQRNQCIFQFARALKSLPEYRDCEAREVRDLVREWHRRAKPVIGTKEFEETWSDFVVAWDNVALPMGADSMAHLMEIAVSRDLPAVAMDYDTDAARSLVAFCRELQYACGDGPFYLSARKAGELLGIDHLKAWRWLNMLVADGVLVVAKKGTQSANGGRATRFRYVAD